MHAAIVFLGIEEHGFGCFPQGSLVEPLQWQQLTGLSPRFTAFIFRKFRDVFASIILTANPQLNNGLEQFHTVSSSRTHFGGNLKEIGLQYGALTLMAVMPDVVLQVLLHQSVVYLPDQSGC